MQRNAGSRGGWRCAVKAAERAARRVRMGAGGVRFYLGVVPTVDDAERLRRTIKEKAPK